MNACNLTAAVTALANSIACGLKAEEINLLSSVFMQLGDTLATIAAHRALTLQRNKESDSALKYAVGLIVLHSYLRLISKQIESEPFA